MTHEEHGLLGCSVVCLGKRPWFQINVISIKLLFLVQQLAT
jgi:hypothetical protein